MISIHAPSRGRPGAGTTAGPCRYFNPRPLAGATTPYVVHYTLWGISIHAPSRGRLHSTPSFHAVLKISIHAPSRGRRHCPKGNSIYTEYFNPRPLAGATQGPGNQHHRYAISIHAPSRGRPFQLRVPGRLDGISIHAPSRGRHLFPVHPDFVTEFQSTPPRGGDNLSTGWMALTRIFQSTPPRGGDVQIPHELPHGGKISIHAPSRGRHGPTGGIFVTHDFNPRPLAGATG